MRAARPDRSDLTSIDPFKTLEVLERLHSQQAEGSEEDEAVQLAAKALVFIFANNHYQEFQEFLDDAREDTLTAEQKDHLRKLGLDPDE